MPRTLWDLLNALFRRCKKNTSEQRYIGDLYTRGSANPSKNSVKFLLRGPGWEPLPAAWSLKIDGF